MRRWPKFPWISGDEVEDEFIGSLTWSLFATLRQQGQNDRALAIVLKMVEANCWMYASFDSNVNPMVEVARFLVDQNGTCEAWDLLKQYDYGLPSCDLSAKSYEIQQKEHIVLLYNLIGKFIESRNVLLCFQVLEKFFTFYKGKKCQNNSLISSVNCISFVLMNSSSVCLYR